MTDMIISIDGEATLGTKCPTHKLEIKERKMTSKETIQQTKEDIAILQEKLKKLEELEIQKSKSPVEKAFKEVYGYYPEGCERSIWFAFQKGYEASQKDYKVGEYQPTPPITNGFFEGNPPNGCSSWSEFFEEFIRTGNLRGLKISSLNNKVKEPKPKSQTLLDIVYEWCDDDNQPTCEELVNRIEKWFPDEFDPNEAYEIGWNEAIQSIKEKLR